MHKYNYANANPITGSDPTGYETYSELLTSISIQGTLVRSLTFGIINTGRIVVAKLLTSQQVDTLDVLETFAKSQLGYFFIETTFWETLPMINYGSGMFSETKLGDKVNRVSGDLLNKYYSTPLSTVEEITSQNNKKTAIGMSEGGSDVPNPYGKKGGPAHQKVIESITPKEKGNFIRKEVKFDTTGGAKAYRYADAVEYNKNGEVVAIY